MAVILLAGNIPRIPSLLKAHEVHLISNTSKLWSTIAVLRPTLIIIDDNLQSLDARKFCKDCKQNKNTRHIAIILLSDNTALGSHADSIIGRPVNDEVLNETIERLLK